MGVWWCLCGGGEVDRKKSSRRKSLSYALSLSFELETLGGAIKNRKVPYQKVRLEMTKECPREPQNLDR